MLFRFENLGKEFQGIWLFRGISAHCDRESRIGLVGRNGSGKTTLLDLIEGRLSADEGRLMRSNLTTTSRVDQIAVLDLKKTVCQEALEAFGGLKRMEREILELEQNISLERGDVPKAMAQEYENLQTRFRLQGGYDYEARAQTVLFGLGFDEEDLGNCCGHLSGGQQSRLLLAKALLQPAQLLLLDEPTNHLDLTGILWLTEYLRASSSTFVLISHDREFLDSVTERTWELEAGTFHDYPAAYTPSRGLRNERIRLQQKEYETQLEQRRKTEDFIRRNIAGQKTKQAQARRKQLQKTEWVSRPLIDEPAPQVNIPEAGRGGALTFEIRNGVIGFARQPLLRRVNLQLLRGDKLGILGGNGTGKTTLLRTILGELPLLEGELQWGAHLLPAYFAQEARFADSKKTIFDYLAEMNPAWTDLEIRKLAALFLFKDEEVHKRVNQLSGGERSRLWLAQLFSRPSNVLILDEPTNHLDIHSREVLERALRDYDGTLIVVSHDRYFLRKTVDRFYVIRDGRLNTARSIDDLEQELAPSTSIEPRPPRSMQSRKASFGLSKNERMRRRQKLAQLEAAIDRIEKEKANIRVQLERGSKDHVLLKQLSTEYQVLEKQAARLYRDWEETGADLEGD